MNTQFSISVRVAVAMFPGWDVDRRRQSHMFKNRPWWHRSCGAAACEQGCVFEQVCCVFDRVTSGWRTRSWARRAGVSRRSWKSCRQSRSGWAAHCPNSPSVRRYTLPLSLFLSVCPSLYLGRAEVNTALAAVWFDCWCVVLSRLCVCCNYCHLKKKKRLMRKRVEYRGNPGKQGH